VEEARQYSALNRYLGAMRGLLIGSFVAAVVALAGMFFPGGLLLKVGLIAFVWLRVALEVVRALLIRETGNSLRWQALSLIVHVVLAAFITYAFAPYILAWSK
jgi:hypothetical protein